MKWSIVTRAICGLVELLCGNSYIVGINQIYDVDIDMYIIASLSIYFNKIKIIYLMIIFCFQSKQAIFAHSGREYDKETSMVSNDVVFCGWAVISHV